MAFMRLEEYTKVFLETDVYQSLLCKGTVVFSKA